MNAELPCDTCAHEVKGCCAYNTKDDYCVLGDKWTNQMSIEDLIGGEVMTIPHARAARDMRKETK